jgi:hypothetical protein
MWWGIGIGGGILYLVVGFTLGLMTLRNGHGWMPFRDLLPDPLDFRRVHVAAREDGTNLGRR